MLSKIERGKRRWNAETLSKIAAALGVPPATLLSMLPPEVGKPLYDIATIWATLTSDQQEIVLQLIRLLKS